MMASTSSGRQCAEMQFCAIRQGHATGAMHSGTTFLELLTTMLTQKARMASDGYALYP
jgi:hypothetical protein